MPDENSITFAGATLTYQAKDGSVVARYGIFSETVPASKIDELMAWFEERRNANQSVGT